MKTTEKQSDKATGPSKLNVAQVAYLLTSVLFIGISIALLICLPSRGQILIQYLVLLIMSMAVAAFVFGVMRSYAQYSGKQMNGTLQLSGPVVGVALVMVGGYMYLKNIDPNGSGLTPQTDFCVRFMMNDAEGAEQDILSRDNLIYKQNQPVYREAYTLAKQPDGSYFRDSNVDLPGVNESYQAKIRRPINAIRQGDLSALPVTVLCFQRTGQTDDNHYRAVFSCADGGICLPDESATESWLEPCGTRVGWLEFLAPTACAQDSQERTGWIVPSLQTLGAQNQTDGITFTHFRIRSALLNGLEDADSFSYEIFVNDTRVFIDGWAPEDTRRPLYEGPTIDLQFGLENLDFSGANEGRERLRVVFHVYRRDQLLRSLTVERWYVALRSVARELVPADGIVFEWTGDYIVGKAMDGYEVFFWATSDRHELAKRKRWFDSANVRYGNYPAVAVVRPPLGRNRDYGLVIGLTKENSSIEFTFSRDRADDILAWVQRDLQTIRVTDDYGPHPIVRRDSWVEMLDGLPDSKE